MKTQLLACVIACIGFAAACDESSSAVKETAPPDGGASSGAPPPAPNDLDAGTLPDGAPADCFMNPKTHFEIINACTTAVKVSKKPTLPLLYADGGLPPAP